MPIAPLGKVLLVDDDDKLTFIVAAHLRAHGYEVREANNGQDGVQLAASYLPDVIVMDVCMPVMDGLDATRELKRNPVTASIPIIMLTGKTRTEDLVVGLEAGAEEYVAKPFEMSEVLARVRSMMRLAAAHQELDEANDRLANQVASKTRHLELLYHYARSLNELTDADDIHQLVVETVQRLTGSSRISLMLKDDKGETLRCVSAVGIDADIVGRIKVKAMEGVAGQVFGTGKTFVAKAYGEGADSEIRKRYATEDFLSTPLISTSLVSQDEVVGVLNVTDRMDASQFSQDEIDCIRSIADSAAIAIGNARRRQQLRDSIKVLLLTVGRLAEYRDEETSDHLQRVAQYARILAGQLAQNPRFAKIITDEFIRDIHQAAPLHDIGKVGIRTRS